MGLGKEAKTSLALSLLQTPVQSKEEMNKLASLVRAFGFEYGFDEPEIRYRAYEILLGITKTKTLKAKELLDNTKFMLREGKLTADLVICNDVNRSFVHFEEGKDFEGDDLANKKLELKAVLHCVVVSNPQLSYYQGLNFITEMFYLEYGMLRTFLIMDALVRFLFSPYMEGNKSFETTLQKRSAYVYAIASVEIPDFSEIITFDDHVTHKDHAMHRINFAASWMLTFFAYKLNDHQKIMKIFDFLVCSLNPFGICYLVVAFMKAIFERNGITKDTQKHETMQVLFNTKFNDLDLDKTINEAFLLLSNPNHQLFELDKRIEKNKKASILNNAFGGFFKFLKKNT